MAIEAELKARLEHPDDVRAALATRADVEHSSYADTYYDDAAHRLDAGQRELRIRTKRVGDESRHILTYKEAPVDETTGSKPEHETDVTEPAAVDALLKALGYEPVIAFTKECDNYAFSWTGRDLLATVVTVPELDGTFLEVETMADEGDLTQALDDLRALLAELGVTPDSLTTELYTDEVAARRHRS